MTLDPRTPVLVGVAHVEQRVDDPREVTEPLDLMVQACREAAEDARATVLLGRIDSVRVVRGRWRYSDPARVVAERLGAPAAQTVGTAYGGNMVQSTLNDTALEIQRGERDVVMLTGAEIGRSQARAQKAGVKLTYADAPGDPDVIIGTMEPMMHEAERVRGIMQPIQMYPIFENAIRRSRGESIEAHRERVSELWARFSTVASQNPHAWIRDAVSAETIRTPSASNRMVGFPYPKLMNSNNAVDQAAALLLCSAEAAERVGVPRDRWVFPHVGTDAHDHYFVSERDNLHSSPAIRLAGRKALELAGRTPAEIQHVDVYSCFPSAVQVAAAEIGLGEERPLTVTGGLTFGGGPLNNYVMHSIARMGEVLRDDAGSFGLITANGGYLTKHSFGIYSTDEPSHPFLHADLQEEVDRHPKREPLVDWNGPVEIESYTVMWGPDGPHTAHAACLLDDGRRTWANSTDADLATAMTQEEFGGRRARVNGEGVFEVV